MFFLTVGELLHVARRATGIEVQVRDHGLLAAAAARPQATAFGQDAYPSREEKAAALLHSLARHHALVDGNERRALAGTIAFLGVNGRVLTWSDDEAYDIVMAVASGRLDEVAEIAHAVRRGTSPRRPAAGG